MARVWCLYDRPAHGFRSDDTMTMIRLCNLQINSLADSSGAIVIASAVKEQWIENHTFCGRNRKSFGLKLIVIILLDIAIRYNEKWWSIRKQWMQHQYNNELIQFVHTALQAGLPGCRNAGVHTGLYTCVCARAARMDGRPRVSASPWIWLRMLRPGLISHVCDM